MNSPSLTRELVLEKLRRCFAEETEAARVLAMLDRYGTKPWHPERDRVHLAILKQCNGQVERVRTLVEMACADFRDVLVGAEYPEEFSVPPGQGDLRAVRERDRRQYVDWLNAD